MNEEQRSAMLRSTCKVVAHETCHIFGIRHCVYYQCVMCGSNNLQEAGKKPLFLCPVDLRKLHSALNFDIVLRYRALLDICSEFGWTDDAAWLEQRLTQPPTEPPRLEVNEPIPKAKAKSVPKSRPAAKSRPARASPRASTDDSSQAANISQ